MKKIIFAGALFLAFAFTGCNKDTEEINPERMKLIDRMENLDVPEPIKNSSNPNAQQVVEYVNSVKSVSGFFSWFDVPEDARRENTKATSEVYTWSYEGTTVWETLTETAMAYKWLIEVNEGAGRKKLAEAEEMKDGSEGWMKIYDYQNDEALIMTYYWTFDAAGNCVMTLEFTDGTLKYESKINVDESGEVRYWMDEVLFYYFQWNTDGSGSYSMYDETGAEVMTESWSVDDL